MSEWKEYKLGEIAEILDYKRKPLSSMERSTRKGIYPYYGASGIIDSIDDYIFDGEHILISEDGENLRTRQTPIAFLANGKFWVNNHAHILKADYVHSRLICYYFAQLDLNPYITGAVQPKLSQESLNRIPLYLPTLIKEREKIVFILSSLDDKIDLLHRENATLEQMAETLFRQWFVVEAKEEWEEKPLSSIATFLNGLACQKYPPKNGIDKLPVLKIRELSSGIGNDSDWATTEVGEEYIVHAGDVIFAWSASLMVKIWDGEDCILNQHLFKVTSDKYPKWFYYFWCKHHLNEFISIAQSHATTMGHIKRGDLDTAMVLVPSDNELLSMTAQMEGLLKKMENNNEQINTLVQTRDRLLPRLMNNEIKVE